MKNSEADYPATRQGLTTHPQGGRRPSKTPEGHKEYHRDLGSLVTFGRLIFLCVLSWKSPSRVGLGTLSFIGLSSSAESLKADICLESQGLVL